MFVDIVIGLVICCLIVMLLVWNAKDTYSGCTGNCNQGRQCECVMREKPND